MDFMEKIVDLRSQKKKLADQAAKLVEEGKLEESGKLADQMEAINKQIAGLEAQICREEAARTCPVCAAPVQEGDAYCRECGSKL